MDLRPEMTIHRVPFSTMDGSDVVLDIGSQQDQREIDPGDISGHRIHYIGVHLPQPEDNGHRHKHRHKHHHHHHHRHRHKDQDKDRYPFKSRSEGNTPANSRANSDIDCSVDSLLLDKNVISRLSEDPHERVKFLLGQEDGNEDGKHESHEIFTELEELTYGSDGEELEWKEMARWIKYEEDVDVGADRWSKPHVATLPLHSLFELRTCLINGTVCLDMESENIIDIADQVLDKLVSSEQLEEEKRDQVREALLRKHHHQSQSKSKNKEKKGRSMSQGSSLFHGINKVSDFHHSSPNIHCVNNSVPNSVTPSLLSVDNSSRDRLTNTDSAGSLSKVSSNRSLRARHSFMRKIPVGAEATNVLVGEVNFLSKLVIAFVRMERAVYLEDLTEVPIPTRFLFILLGPKSEDRKRYHEIGRCVATLMSDMIFHDVAYKAKNVDDLISGIDEFINSVTVLPPGAWDPNIRIEPPKVAPIQTKRMSILTPNGHAEGADEDDGHHDDEELERTGRLFGGLYRDIKRRVPLYLSDYRDGLNVQCISSVFFVYFAIITPVITFGGLMSEGTGNQIGALESLLGASICGIAFHLFAGQPLTMLGLTGPIVAFDIIVAGFSENAGIDYLSFRWWIGFWTMVTCIIIVATDASALVKYFTRFIEESFSSLISFIFLYESVHKLIKIYFQYSGGGSLPENVTYEYYCDAPTGLYNYNVEGGLSNVTLDECDEINGTLVGDYCGAHPEEGDVFLMSLVLMLGTFFLAFQFKEFKTAAYFPTIVRTTVSDFAVLIAVIIMVGVDMLFGIQTQKLLVPSEFQPTSEARTSWIVDPFNGNPWWTVFGGIPPALLLTILVFMDQQITAVIVNRKENKFKKGGGYHLDLLVVGLMIGVCSLMGLPWFVAATVLSINHVKSLMVESECKAPGEQPVLIGCREQRVTGLATFVLVGLATLMTGILGFVPMPVLYGVFLFMGISSLRGVQFVDRLALFFMPLKYQPDYVYLRHVGIRRVHLFTFIQLLCLVVLWVIKSTKAAVIFPIMVLAMVVVRKLMDKIFTQQELTMLDDVMPERIKRDKQDRKKKRERAQAECDKMNNIPGRVQVPLSDGNVLSIPVEKVEFQPDLATINIPEDMAKTGMWKTLTKNAKDGAVIPKKPQKKDRSSLVLTPKLSMIPGSPTYMETKKGFFEDIRIEVPEPKTLNLATKQRKGHRRETSM